MLLIFLVRRLSVRGRLIAGLAITLAGAALIVASAAGAAGLLIHGVITVVIGGILVSSAEASRHRARLARQPDSGQDVKIGARLVRGGR